MTGSRKKLETTTETSAPMIERRGVLGMIGAGGLLLTLPGITRAAEAAATPATDDCGPAQPCPPSRPPLPPGKPDLTKLPGLAQLIGVLARDHADARTNRRHFNTCPDKFLDWYSLTNPDVAALIDFKSSTVDGQFVYLGTQVPSTSPEFASYLQLYAATSTFWNDWDTYTPKDCYDDQLDCTSEVQQLYARPDTRVIDVKQTKDVSAIVLTVRAEGLVRNPAMEVVRVADNTVLPVTDIAVDPKSTFRCGKITGKAVLETGKRYIVQLKIAGTLVRTSDEFAAL